MAVLFSIVKSVTHKEKIINRKPAVVNIQVDAFKPAALFIKKAAGSDPGGFPFFKQIFLEPYKGLARINDVLDY
jgi:hypothetical protein